MPRDVTPRGGILGPETIAMATLAKYCKAYYAKDFRRFPGWRENLENLHHEGTWNDGAEVVLPRERLDDDVLFLHENFVVTDGLAVDENVIFDDVSDAWKTFCTNELAFEVPED